MTTIFNLHDHSGLDSTIAQVWVAGWINGGDSTAFQVLQSDGSFGGSSPTSVPFYAVSTVPSVSLSATTNGNDRLLFVVAPSTPADLTVAPNNGSPEPIQYTQFPYAVPPGVAAPGPFDVFEFGLDAQDDVSAVSGFGLNLSFAVRIGGTLQAFGMRDWASRKGIGEAFTKFVANEAKSLPAATAFAALLYDGPIATGAPTPPLVGGQYFGIADPNDMLGALSTNYTRPTDSPLATWWDSTLEAFFAAGNYLSINLSSNPPAPNIYSGQSTMQTNPKTGVSSPAFTLSNGTNSYSFFMPLADGATAPGLTGAQYVFQQAFGDLTPAGSGGDAGLLQDCIWEALCRGVALAGVSTTPITNAESTTAWNDETSWYQAGQVSHLYAKFMHYSTIDGTDSRLGGMPLMHDNAAYGFSMDENPLGPYSGPNVPSKTVQNVPDGSTVDIFVGPWDKVAA